nr:penicillin-binding transpeptidase domain-containing protein [Armatimonadota bacterium]
GLTREKSVQRKLHELLVATQIEKSYTKPQILEMYLNQVAYGQNSFGVQAAARTYFGKDVDKLDLAQCALLAGLPNRPGVFNPYKDKDAAKQQRDIVLLNMFQQHYITPEQFAKAKDEYIHLAAPKPPKQGNQIFHAPYFVDYVVDQLKKKYGQDALTHGNMNVYTTLNLTMQEQAEKAITQGIADARDHGATQGCLVALDPKTGEIRAMVGGTDYDKNQFNIVTQARRQPGSLFKAVVYSAAIDSAGYTEESRVYDAPVTFHASGGKAYSPRDDSGFSYNHVSLRTAMAYSINVPAVKVLKDIGPQMAIFYARKMGVNADTPLAPVLSLALGASGVSPLEMADVYATIASGGNRPIPTALTRIADASDKTIEDIPAQVETRVLKTDTARQLDDMLRAVVTAPKGTGAGAIDVPEARGKTGTTQGHKDVWFIGYTKDLVCAVWAGHPVHNAKTGRDGDAEMESGAWGGTVCVPIWRNFMLQALPVYKAVLAKEAARSKATVQPKPMPPMPTVTRLDGSDASNSSGETDTYYNSRRYRRHHRRQTDSTYGNTPSDTTSADAAAPAVTDATDNADGTRSATVDNNTGLLAPPGSPNSHRETFSTGAAPNVMSPQYDNTSSDSGDSSSSPRRRTRQRANPDNGTSGDAGGATGDTSGDSSSPRPRRRASTPRARSEQDYVTVRVNPNDGKLATKWTPQVIEKRFPKGQEPHNYSTMDPPPPGEH